MPLVALTLKRTANIGRLRCYTRRISFAIMLQIFCRSLVSFNNEKMEAQLRKWKKGIGKQHAKEMGPGMQTLEGLNVYDYPGFKLLMAITFVKLQKRASWKNWSYTFSSPKWGGSWCQRNCRTWYPNSFNLAVWLWRNSDKQREDSCEELAKTAELVVAIYFEE